MPLRMPYRKAGDPVLGDLERILSPGRFIPHSEMSDFVADLRDFEERLARLILEGEAERAAELYRAFLWACYEKIEECHDSGGALSLFFDALLCGWLQAREAAGQPEHPALRRILGGREHGPAGLPREPEDDAAVVLDTEEPQRSAVDFEAELENVLTEVTAKPGGALFEYSNQVRLPAIALKEIYESTNNPEAYAAVCERVGYSPRDCERLAELEAAASHWTRALAWVEQAEALEPTRAWHNESSLHVAELKTRIMGQVGGKRRRLSQASAWPDGR